MNHGTPDATKSRLLTAARTCLLDKGYADTTVRDLIGESGTNLASINYHFGSKEALLNQALYDLNGEWGELLFGAVAAPDLSAAERWQCVIDSIDDNRAMWFVNFEAISMAQHNDTIRAGLAERGEAARNVLAHAFGGDDEGSGSRHYAMLIGVAAQWLLDPESAPSATEITSAAPED